jgi:hypothetical protein
MTVASLKDLGYQVDLDTADPYTLPVTGLRLDGGGDDEVGRFIVLPPDDLLLV